MVPLLPLDTLTLVEFCGALGSFGGRPLGFGEDIAVLGGKGTLSLDGLPHPFFGVAFGKASYSCFSKTISDLFLSSC